MAFTTRRTFIRARNAARKTFRRAQLSAFLWAADLKWVKQVNKSHTKRGPGRIHQQGPLQSASEE